MFEAFNHKGFSEFRGKKDGPTVTILAGIHGDERAVIKALARINTTLQKTGIESGRVILGWGNPQAMIARSRFVESDMNRLFVPDEFLNDTQLKSLEYKRAQELKRPLSESHVMLDLHNTKNPLGVPFALGEKNSYIVSKHFPVRVRLSGVDALQPGGTDWYMNQIVGSIGICLEAGFNGNPQTTDTAEKSAYALLIKMGNINGQLTTYPQRTFNTYEVYRIKTNEYALCRPFKDFETIKPGQAIAIDGTEIIKAQKPGAIVFASRMILTNRTGTQTFFLTEEVKN